MRTPRPEIIERLRENFPVGCRVELVRMDDVQAPPIGTLGTVIGVDAIGTIHVDWDNGCGLGVAYGEDDCRRIDEKVKEQILAIRDTGLANMFDLSLVQRLAYERDFYELVLYLEDHRKEYVHFILTGEA